jgi:ABC-type bacteriocin/lantibiotic exporter with double-glycine peptidase domain
MGNPGIGINDVEDYIEKFGLIEFVQSNKQGMYVLLDPVGKRLSKQVRQKILLIRAMLGGHRLLLLEEPFEYLDKPTSAILLNWLKNQKNTTILIASDDENLSKECDSVLNL